MLWSCSFAIRYPFGANILLGIFCCLRSFMEITYMYVKHVCTITTIETTLFMYLCLCVYKMCLLLKNCEIYLWTSSPPIRRSYSIFYFSIPTPFVCLLVCPPLIYRSALLFTHIKLHYSDVIMSAIASQITGVSIVCPTVCSGADQRRYQSSVSLTFATGFSSQRTSNAENVSIWWSHHVFSHTYFG